MNGPSATPQSTAEAMQPSQAYTGFALAGLAAPPGILGADAGTGYSQRKPRAPSRLPHPVPSHGGGCRIGTRPYLLDFYSFEKQKPYTALSCRPIGPPWRAPVETSMGGPIRIRPGFTTPQSTGTLGRAERTAAPTPQRRLEFCPHLFRSLTPPPKQKRLRRAAPEQGAPAGAPRLRVAHGKQAKCERGVLVTPPSTLTPA